MVSFSPLVLSTVTGSEPPMLTPGHVGIQSSQRETRSYYIRTSPVQLVMGRVRWPGSLLGCVGKEGTLSTQEGSTIWRRDREPENGNLLLITLVMTDEEASVSHLLSCEKAFWT